MKKIMCYLEDDDFKLLSKYKRKCNKTNKDVINIILDILKLNEEFKTCLSTDLFCYMRSIEFDIGEFKDEDDKKQQYRSLKNLKKVFDSNF